jgi:hypothetical protein
MEPLPKKYKLLKEIGRSLNEYLSSPNTPVEIRSTELYDVASKIPLIKSEFPTNRFFNQFLRKQHQDNILSTFLSYRVDTMDKDFYQWHFRKKPDSNDEAPINNETLEGTYNYYKNSKTTEASDGTKLNSKQEVLIYEELKRHSHLLIKIEYPITRHGETKFVDFIVQNRMSQREFLWEHFGMTNNDSYKLMMIDKIEWYKNNGFRTIEEGGNLICTYYSNDNNLQKDILKTLKIITSTSTA